MKVGVYIGDAPPEVGGGYTFVDEVLREIERRSADLSQRFCILTTGTTVPRGTALEMASLAPALAHLAPRVQRWLGRSLDRLLNRPTGTSHAERASVDRLLAAAGIDVVWYLMPGVCWSRNVPYITVVWDLQHRLQPYFPEVNAHGEGSQRDALYRSTLPHASLVIAGTNVGSEEIQRFYGVAPERIRILPHPTPGFALAAADQPTRPRPEAAPLDPYIFYPAQLWAHKNHVNLLEALRIVRERHHLPLSLVLTGSDQGNGRHVLEVAQRLKVAEAVRWLGFVSRDDLVGLYQHALALTYVTHFGPENLPPLEAFALGCPVIASDVSGAREQLAGAAWLVDPTKPEQIADAIRRLYDAPEERAQLGERGRQRAHRFTSREFVQGVLTWLDDFAAIRACWPSGQV